MSGHNEQKVHSSADNLHTVHIILNTVLTDCVGGGVSKWRHTLSGFVMMAMYPNLFHLWHRGYRSVISADNFHTLNSES